MLKEMRLFDKNFGVWALRSFFLRRFFDLQFHTLCGCLVEALRTRSSSRMLDFGSGFSPYGKLIPTSHSRRTLDAHHPADYSSWKEIPGDVRFDVILALEVLEHLEDPAREFLKEAKERLADDGEIWISIPYSVRIHPCPDDWHRWTPQGLHRLLEREGFDTIEFLHRGPFPAAIVAKWTYGNFLLLKKPFTFLLGTMVLPFTCVALLFAHILPVSKTTDLDPLGFFVRAKPRRP